MDIHHKGVNDSPKNKCHTVIFNVNNSSSQANLNLNYKFPNLSVDEAFDGDACIPPPLLEPKLPPIMLKPVESKSTMLQSSFSKTDKDALPIGYHIFNPVSPLRYENNETPGTGSIIMQAEEQKYETPYDEHCSTGME
ncbi:hypothetical protein CDAR_302051 [Caerostris darwini]|uniref:Uncharacterized protein n=1 Tax=Caerostris darwini TaxID=1538125 RepID=A0AAV4TBS5_9ARAC|nr:hypothetical protein CDAR_302051 [Caerostris darwini]